MMITEPQCDAEAKNYQTLLPNVSIGIHMERVYTPRKNNFQKYKKLNQIIPYTSQNRFNVLYRMTTPTFRNRF